MSNFRSGTEDVLGDLEGNARGKTLAEVFKAEAKISEAVSLAQTLIDTGILQLFRVTIRHIRCNPREDTEQVIYVSQAGPSRIGVKKIVMERYDPLWWESAFITSIEHVGMLATIGETQLWDRD